MRALFGVLGLVLVLAVVGLLAKKQLGALSEVKVPATAPAASVQPPLTVQQQSQQIQQQFKAATEAALQQPRPEPDDK
jgi:hypothetical protein